MSRAPCEERKGKVSRIVQRKSKREALTSNECVSRISPLLHAFALTHLLPLSFFSSQLRKERGGHPPYATLLSLINKDVFGNAHSRSTGLQSHEAPSPGYTASTIANRRPVHHIKSIGMGEGCRSSRRGRGGQGHWHALPAARQGLPARLSYFLPPSSERYLRAAHGHPAPEAAGILELDMVQKRMHK